MTKTAPHSIESEQGILGCIFLDPNECIPKCMERLKHGSESFYDIRHKEIYSVLVEMFEKRTPIDLISVKNAIEARNTLAGVGGIGYLAQLPDIVPSAANLDYYACSVEECAIRRDIIKNSNSAIENAYDGTVPIEELISGYETTAMAVAKPYIRSASKSISELVKGRLSFWEECHTRGGGLSGLETGFRDLDRMTCGLQNGDFIVIAARPSLGKTSLAMNIAEHVALNSKLPVGVFSLEMSSASLTGRLISCRAKVNQRILNEGRATERDMQMIAAASLQVSKAPIYIDDTAGMTVTQLKAKARRMVSEHGVKLIVIDYLQLLKLARRMDRREEVDEISRQVKEMAKDLNIPVIVICQLNRELDKQAERKPRLSDLRESGQIEQDADVIGILYNTDPAAMSRGDLVLAVNLLIAKQRNGVTGDINLTFHKETSRFSSISPIQP